MGSLWLLHSQGHARSYSRWAAARRKWGKCWLYLPIRGKVLANSNKETAWCSHVLHSITPVSTQTPPPSPHNHSDAKLDMMSLIKIGAQQDITHVMVSDYALHWKSPFMVISGRKDVTIQCIILHNNTLHNIYASPYIIKVVIKLGRMRRQRHATPVAEMRNA